MDLSHGLPFARPVKIYDGDYDDIVDAGIIIITAGANQKPDETRFDLIHKMWRYTNRSSRRSQSAAVRESFLSYPIRSISLPTRH